MVRSNHISWKLIHGFIILLVVSLLFSCKLQKRLDDEEIMLSKYSIDIEETDHSHKIDYYAVDGIIKQKPARKIYVWFYNLPDPEKTERDILEKEQKIEAKNKKLKERFDRKVQKKIEKNKKRKEKGKPIKEYKILKKTAPIKEYSPPLRQWIKEFGVAPTIYDSTKTQRSSDQISLYLKKKGFYRNSVSHEVTIDSTKQKAYVTYKITPGKPYFFGKFEYKTEDYFKTALDRQWKGTKTRKKEVSYIKTGGLFDIEKLDDERARIADYMQREMAYYMLTKDYIYFTADSLSSNDSIDVFMHIKPYRVQLPGVKEPVETTHKVYRIRNVYFHFSDTTNVNAKELGIEREGKYFQTLDTLVIPLYKEKHGNPVKDENGNFIPVEGFNYYFYYNGEIPVSPELMIQNLFFLPNKYAGKRYLERTLRRYSQFGTFKSVDIQMKLEEDDPASSFLNCHIYLVPAKKQSFTAETSGVSEAPNLGINSSISYNNRNAFGQAENVNITLSGGLEAQPTLIENSNEKKSILDFLNTYEYGIKLDYKIPKLTPNLVKSLSHSAMPNTNFGGLYNFQGRPDYDRKIYNLSYSIEFRETKTKVHTFTPFEISAVDIEYKGNFEETLNNISDPFILNSYQDHLSSILRYTFWYNNQQFTKKPYFTDFKATLELSGLLPQLYNRQILKKEVPSKGYYSLLGQQYSHFVRLKFEYKWYYKFGNKSQFAMRMIPGIGFTFDNLKALPFEKSFSLGGASSLRAWQARTVGPGNFLDTLRSFDKIGDVMFEGNIEYRFDIIDYIKGAVFLDMGNIWFLNEESTERIEGVFDIKNIYKQLAIGSGFGIRYDMEFFIIRLDIGVKIFDPSIQKAIFNGWKDDWQTMIDAYNASRPESEHLKDYNFFHNLNFNIGIGLPF